MTLTESIGALHQALEIGEEYYPAAVPDSRAALDKAVARRALGADVTIVALAGPTGAGKSSLLNALAGQEISRASAIRPTTAEALAVSNTPASDVLDWLEIKQRHRAPLTDRGKMVLLDLPDIDSTEFLHRETAKKLTALVDVVVWVLDPQKYADAVVHEDYLTTLLEHAASTVVVLNQADRLDAATLDSVLADANRLVHADGLHVDVIATSTVTGRGLVKLRDRLEEIVAKKAAAHERLAADLRAAGRSMIGALHTGGGKAPANAAEADFAPVVEALATAGGAEVVAQASAGSYTARARKATGWPVTRWIASRKIDPLKRLRLGGNQPRELDVYSGGTVVTGRTVVTGAQDFVSPAMVTAARGRLRSYLKSATAHMPGTWGRRVRADMVERGEKLLANVDGVIAASDLEARRRPWWWMLINFLQWIALIVAVAGGIWLAGLVFADLLQLQLPDPPAWGIAPMPTVMLAGGLLFGWVLAAVGRVLAGRGATRTRERVRRRLRSAIAEMAESAITEPLAGELARYARFYELAGSLTRTEA